MEFTALITPPTNLRVMSSQDRDEEIEMEAGSQHILKYSAIEDLVREGAVRLI